MMRKYPLAFASLLLGVLSFVHLFGLEKAVLAVILGGAAIREAAETGSSGRGLAYAGIILGSLYVLVLLVIVFIKGPAIIGTIGKLQ